MISVALLLTSAADAQVADLWSPLPSASCPLTSEWWLLATWEVDPQRPTVVLNPTNWEDAQLWSPLDGVRESLAWPGDVVGTFASADVSGDGRLDLVVRTTDETGAGAVGVLLEPDDVSDVVMVPTNPGWKPLVGLGDVNGDGTDDVAVGQELWVSLPSDPWLTHDGVVGTDTDEQHVSRLGDVDSDGIDDLSVTDWFRGYPYQRAYGPVDVLLGDTLFPTHGGTIGSDEDAYGYGIVDVNVDADSHREFLVVEGHIADDYGGVVGGLMLVDDLADGLGELASYPFAVLDDPAVVGASGEHKLLPLREGSADSPALVAWIIDDRIEELEVGPAQIQSVAVYRPPSQWEITDGLVSDLDADGTPDLVAVGRHSFDRGAEIVAWLRGDGTATDEPPVTCSATEPEPEPVDPPATRDSRTCGCSAGPQVSGLVLWLAMFWCRRRGPAS